VRKLIENWDGNLAIRLSEAEARELGLVEGDNVDFQVIRATARVTNEEGTPQLPKLLIVKKDKASSHRP
jgi:hypothetical protein